MQSEITYTLKYPVNFEGALHQEITLRRPKAKDLRAVDGKSDMDGAFLLIARLSGWPPAGVDELDATDIEHIGDILKDFMGKPQAAA